jgi:hypothetical protein
MRKAIIILTIICCTTAQLCAQNDSLTQILDDIQDDDVSLSNWLEILSEQVIDPEKSSGKRYPGISLTHRFQYTLERNEALTDHIFIGSPFESYTRLKINLYKNLSTGLLIQKDVGEKSLYDHLSGFLSWNHPGYPIKIIIGNFYIRGAEGLLLSGPFSLPKNALIVKSSSSRYVQARPFMSSNEYDGFWGGVVEVGDLERLKLITFYSNILRDGILSRDKNRIIGFDRGGYHRTFSERAKENRIGEKSYGGVISFPVFFIDQIGLTYVKTRYSPELNLLSPDERRRNYFKFYGSDIQNYSVFYFISFQDLLFSGEIVPVKSKNISYLSTLNFYQLDWHFVLKSWHIPSQFQSPFGRIPSDSNPFPQSVEGFMIGAIGNPLSDMKITTFWFHKKDLWRSYFQPLPLQKKEFYIQGEYRFGAQKYLFIRYHISSSNFYSSDLLEKTKRTKHSFRLQIKQRFSTRVRFQSRFEKVILNFFPFQTTYKGINFYQDIYWQIFKPITLQLRFSTFNTDDYNSRIYEYENDLPNVFSNYALYGRGRKWYVLLTFKPAPIIKIWLKYRRITFDGVESIGGGITTINSDVRQDVHLQVEFRY